MASINFPLQFCVYLCSHRFAVHRVVMGAASRFLKLLFGPRFEEGRNNEILLDEIDGAMLKLIINFCYTGRVNLSEANINDVLAAASSLEVTKLEQKCREFWEINFSSHNLVETLLNADKHDLKNLREKSLKAICADFENIPMNELQKIDGNIFHEILSNDLVTANETVVFERSMMWLDANEKDQMKFVSKFLSAIRLQYIPAEVNLMHSLSNHLYYSYFD